MSPFSLFLLYSALRVCVSQYPYYTSVTGSRRRQVHRVNLQEMLCCDKGAIRRMQYRLDTRTALHRVPYFLPTAGERTVNFDAYLLHRNPIAKCLAGSIPRLTALAITKQLNLERSIISRGIPRSFSHQWSASQHTYRFFFNYRLFTDGMNFYRYTKHITQWAEFSYYQYSYTWAFNLFCMGT